PPRNKSGGGKGRSRPHQSNVDQGRRKTPTRPSSPPQTAKDLEAPLEVEAAYSMTCSRNRALTTRARSTTPSSNAKCSRSTTTASRIATRAKKKDTGDKGGDDE